MKLKKLIEDLQSMYKSCGNVEVLKDNEDEIECVYEEDGIVYLH